MTEFVGKFLNKIDKKGRVSVPALWRPKLLGEGFSGIVAQLTNGYNSVDGYSKNYLERYQDWLDKQDPHIEGNEYEATLIFGSSMLPFDREGRVLLPDLIKKKAQLENDALFVGMGRKFRIWEPSSFDSYEKKAREYLNKRRSLNN
jgi:MraZ protein